MSYRELKQYLLDYFGTAVQSGMIGAMEGRRQVENASSFDDLLSIADMYGIDIDRYIEDDGR